jgi:hypothetical protein
MSPQPCCRPHLRIGRPDEFEHASTGELERTPTYALTIAMGSCFNQVVGVDRLDPARTLCDTGFFDLALPFLREPFAVLLELVTETFTLTNELLPLSSARAPMVTHIFLRSKPPHPRLFALGLEQQG